MLIVKNRSSKKAGRGKTIIATSIKMPNGSANPVAVSPSPALRGMVSDMLIYSCPLTT